MVFSSKTILKNCLLLLKWQIIAVLPSGRNLDFTDFLQEILKYFFKYGQTRPLFVYFRSFHKAKTNIAKI